MADLSMRTAARETRTRVTPPSFPAHVAARIAADWEGDRLPIPGPRKPTGHFGDSDPNMDELLHRARHPRSNQVSCPECHQAYNPGSMHVCTPKAAPAPAAEMLRRVHDHRDAIREGLAAAREYAAREYAASVAA